MRRLLHFLLTILLLLEGSPLLWCANAQNSVSSTAEVTATSLNLRSGPSTQEAVLRSLPNGTRVTILETSGGWARVRLEDETEGWASAKFLAPVVIEDVTPIEEPEEGTPEQPPALDGEQAMPRSGESSPKGRTLGSLLKWTSLGAGAVGLALAMQERSSGNDFYDKYKSSFREGDFTAADQHYEDAASHDDKALVYGLVGGALVGLFVIQQFFLGGDDVERSSGEDHGWLQRFEPPLVFDPRSGTMRVYAIHARF